MYLQSAIRGAIVVVVIVVGVGAEVVVGSANIIQHL